MQAAYVFVIVCVDAKERHFTDEHICFVTLFYTCVMILSYAPQRATCFL